LAAGGAGGQGATANPRFIGIDRVNQPMENSAMTRGGPQGTALNLAGLFNRGQPAVNPNVPAAAAQPVAAMRPVAGPLARPAPASPLANAPMPPVKPNSVANQQVANALRNKNWWQNL
jgi:hypothetical protein